jgi:hypothetical protein
LSGTLAVASDSIESTTISVDSGRDCHGIGGYDDMVPGARVTVTDGGGKVIGIGSLGQGTFDGSSCVFPFAVSGLPSASFYGVEIANRGVVQFSHEEVKAHEVALTLGQ